MTTAADWCAPGTPPTEPDCASLVRVKSLCEMGWHRLLLTGVFLTLIRDHFTNIATTTQETDLHGYVWSPEESSRILIQVVYDFHPETAGKRPAVLVRPNGKTSRALTINDLSGEKPLIGQKQHTIQWIGSHTVLCLQNDGNSAEILASEVENLLQGWSNVLASELRLDRLQVLETGAPAILEEARQTIAVPIMIGWTYQHTYTVRPEALPLRRIPINISHG